MNDAPIFTRNRGGLDKNVWITMIVFAVISLGLFAFKMASNAPCSPIGISLKGVTTGKANSYFLGAAINFSAKMNKAKDISWDFGDHTPEVDGNEVIHAFMHEGNYLVTATVNGKCIESINVNIQQLSVAQVIANQPLLPQEPIVGPTSPNAGDLVNYISANSASSYEWTVLNAPNFPVQHEKAASYTFITPGTQIIELKIDNDPSKVYRKEINVISSVKPATDPNAPAAPTAPVVAPPVMPVRPVETGPKVKVIPDEEFKSMFDAITEGKKDAKSFDEFLCNGAETQVLLNGKDWDKLGTFCDKIHDKKKYVIKGVTAVRNEKNCVTLLKIDYKKKGLLGL